MHSRLFAALGLCLAVHLRAADTNAPARPLHPHAARAGHAAHQRPGRLRRAARLAVSLHDPGDRRPADDIFRDKPAARLEAGCPDRAHHRASCKQPGDVTATLVRSRKNALGAAEKKFRIVCRRPDRADAADGLEQLELFRRRGHGGPGQERGGRDGQERPHQPRLDLHQRGRLLAEPSQFDKTRLCAGRSATRTVSSCRTRVFPT